MLLLERQTGSRFFDEAWEAGRLAASPTAGYFSMGGAWCSGTGHGKLARLFDFNWESIPSTRYRDGAFVSLTCGTLDVKS